MEFKDKIMLHGFVTKYIPNEITEPFIFFRRFLLFISKETIHT